MDSDNLRPVDGQTTHRIGALVFCIKVDTRRAKAALRKMSRAIRRAMEAFEALEQLAVDEQRELYDEQWWQGDEPYPGWQPTADDAAWTPRNDPPDEFTAA